MRHERLSKLNRRGFLGLAGMGGLCALAPSPLWAMARESGDWPTVTAKIRSYVETRKLASAIAALGWGTDEPEYITAGNLSLESDVAVDRDTLWRQYSMTKPITGMAAMMLIGDGRMTLDQPVADFIPEFAEMRVLTDPGSSLDSVPAKHPITIRNLLTHTAGLGYSIITKGPLLQEYLDQGILPGVVSREPIPGFEGGAEVPPLDEFARRVAALPLIAEPGTQWSYSIALDVMGRVIEVASGMSFGDFLQTRLFDPLGMTSSFFQVPDSEKGRLATNYAVIGGLLIPIDPGDTSIFLDKPAFPFGGAGLVSSARDYDRFLAMLIGNGTLDGEQVMRSETVDLGTSNLLPEGVDLTGTWVAGQGFGAGGRVGLGPRAGTYGWAGAAGTIAAVDRKRGLRAAGYAQYMPSEVYPFQSDFIGWVYADALAQAGEKVAA
ncbi:serine hydrolase domain-containing protein [Novosphingopyxis sp.]|uniref:serine hydrolase domain-containing protein n=1 Tax=Novosphingopyxis sp. TaxID=2709690 RepID=UPI003B5A8941